MDLSNWSENNLLDWLLTAGVVVRPTSYLMSLHTGDPGEDGLLNEFALAGYARQAITFNAAVAGESTSSNAQTFTTTDVTGATITHAALWDNNGNCIFYGELAISRLLVNGSPMVFAIGDVVCALD